jgi:hypothetical protein
VLIKPLFFQVPMKNCPETIATKTVNWRYRIADPVISHVSEIPKSSSSPVMNWRYRIPSLDYKVLTTAKSTSEVNWRYRVLGTSPHDLN